MRGYTAVSEGSLAHKAWHQPGLTATELLERVSDGESEEFK